MIVQSNRVRRAPKIQRLCAWMVAAGLLVAASSVSAQSRYGCQGLETLQTPMIEGLGGTFYRIDPDLLMDTRVPDAVVSAAATLSEVLAEKGIQLVVVPVPTKALAMPGHLGVEPALLGYDVRIAWALYADSLARLRTANVATVDAVEALQESDGNEAAFFGTDPRMTNTGLRKLAYAIAGELGETGRGDAQFRSEENGVVDLESLDRFKLQIVCQAELPQVRTKDFSTVLEADGDDLAPIVVAGTQITGAGLNLAGFLAEASGRPIQHEVVSDDSTAALAYYLTSQDPDEVSPAAIVWLLPVWSNPAHFGDQPLRELVAAARSECGVALPGEHLSDGGFRFDLSTVPTDSGKSLRLNTGGLPVAEATFQFSSATGDTRSRTVVRTDPALVSDSVYLPMTGLWSGGPNSVSVETDTSLAALPTLSVCEG